MVCRHGDSRQRSDSCNPITAALNYVGRIWYVQYNTSVTPTEPLYDPGIPGIAIGKPTDPVNAGKFAIINQSSQQVIGYQVSYTYPMGTVIKIAQDGLNVPYEGIAPGTADLIGGSPAGGTPKEIDIDWIVFADGSFYGSEKDASALETRANTRRKFFTEVSTAAHPDDYIDRYMNCKSIECMDGMNKREWGELKQAILSYRINQRGHGAKFPEVLKSYVKAHASYPRKIIRKTQNSASTAKPKDEEDGWEILNWSGTCPPPCVARVASRRSPSSWDRAASIARIRRPI